MCLNCHWLKLSGCRQVSIFQRLSFGSLFCSGSCWSTHTRLAYSIAARLSLRPDPHCRRDKTVELRRVGGVDWVGDSFQQVCLCSASCVNCQRDAPAFAAARLLLAAAGSPAVQQLICIMAAGPSAANPQQQACGGRAGQTDKSLSTPGSCVCVDHAPHTTRAVE